MTDFGRDANGLGGIGVDGDPKGARLSEDFAVALAKHLDETFGISLCEALACERPVVATDFGGFREVVRHGETGLLVPPQDPVALADAIDTLLADPARRHTLALAGRQDVVARFSWPAVVDRVLAAYMVAMDYERAR